MKMLEEGRLGGEIVDGNEEAQTGHTSLDREGRFSHLNQSNVPWFSFSIVDISACQNRHQSI